MGDTHQTADEVLLWNSPSGIRCVRRAHRFGDGHELVMLAADGVSVLASMVVIDAGGVARVAERWRRELLNDPEV